MRRFTAALAALLLVPAFAFAQDEATTADPEQLRQDIADLEARLEKVEKKAATDRVNFTGETVEEAWQRLATGDVAGHNEALAEAIRRRCMETETACVVLAQLSMTVFLLSYPDPVAAFGVPVFTSGQCGFEAVRDLLLGL